MLPLAAVERVARKAGAERISAKAVEALRNVIEEIGMELARDARKAAEHAGRRTIKTEDIKIISGKA